MNTKGFPKSRAVLPKTGPRAYIGRDFESNFVTIVSANCLHRVVSQKAVPGVTIQIEDSEVAHLDDPVVTVHYSKPVLYLAKPQLKPCDAWTRFLVGDRGDFVKKRRLSFSPADIPQEVYTSQIPAGTRSVACYFDPATFKDRTGLQDDWDGDRLNACHSIDGSMMTRAMEELLSEMLTPRFASEILIDSIGQLLLVEIARYFNAKKISLDSPGKRLSKQQLDRILQYVNENDCCLTTDRIAQACNLSTDYLRRAFKNTTGQSLRQYVEQVRLDRAKAMLIEQRLLIKQIAYRAGFADVKSFCIAFRRATGETARDFQARATLQAGPR